MTNSYNEYNNTWNMVKNYIQKKKNFDVFDVTFNHECSNIESIYYLDNYEKINNDYELKKLYFCKSRSYVSELIKNNNFDLIIELGSGWGRNIFHFLNENIINNVDIVSGEYTQGGCDTQEYINNNYVNYDKLKIYRFDYNNSSDFFGKIEKNKYNNILVLSFWSIEQVTYIKDEFIENLLGIGNNIKCVNIEPIGWQINDSSLMKENKEGYRSYYNKNYYIILKKFEENKKIKILNTVVNYFNFDCTESLGSLIEWNKI